MSIRTLGYDNENLDQIVCYFMRTILHLQKSGIENLPVEHSIPAPYASFLDTAMELFFHCLSPELCHLLLDVEYDTFLSKGDFSKEEILGLRIIKELVGHIRYDEDYYGYLLSTEPLWGNQALEYAAFTFYPNLPENIKGKYHIYDFIEHTPESMFRLDDY